MTLLDQLAAHIGGMSDAQKAELSKTVMAHEMAGAKWVPTTGPQLDAYECEADELLYGGQAGGGKSGLIVGLALTRHKRSLIMRRQYGDLSALIDDALEKHGSREGFNGSPPARLRVNEDSVIDFAGALKPGDEQHQKGKPHDFLGIDEASQFLESQVRFLMGWVRSDDPSQRCRVILATNPPEMPGQGEWLMEMYGPWLSETHPLYPTPPGVLRWYVSDEEGNDKWVDGPEPVMIGEDLAQPVSRTFIPAALSDNPFLSGTSYAARLDALPEPLRSAVRDGNWMISHKDHEFQVIPTNWVLAAMERWTPDPPKDAPMCGIGVDVAQGGDDKTVVQLRYDAWFAEPIEKPGRETPESSDVAALVVKYRRNKAAVMVDLGGGYGGPVCERLTENLDTDAAKVIFGFDGSKATAARTKDRMLGFINDRAHAWWRLREALDPDQESGSPIMLPPDSELRAELVTPHWEPTPRGIKIESKKDIVARIGRSTDKGDAVVMAWKVGPTYVTHGLIWKDHVRMKKTPKVKRAYENRKRRR